MIGSRGPLITATAMKIFRGERVGTIYGTISIGSGLGSGLGAWAGGLIHDWTHSYDPVIAFALVAVVLGMIPFLIVRQVFPPSFEASQLQSKEFGVMFLKTMR